MARLYKAEQQLRQQVDDSFPNRSQTEAQAEVDRKAAEAEAAAKEAARQALLKKLGITAEEAALLLS